MNLCFLLDNSITMSQQAYNGLSLLQIAKGYIQKALQNKSFNRFFNGQPLNYHLFLSSSPIPLSTYEHEELHFGNQLKYVEVDPITDLAETMQEMFKHLNKYRILYQAETTFGAVDPFRLKPSLVVVFTDSSDPVTLNTIQEKIIAGQLKSKHDSEVYILRICPPCRDDKTSLEVLRKTVEADESSVMMKSMAEYWNGKYFQVHRYQYGFDVMDSILNTFTPRIHMRFNVIDRTSLQQHFRESGIYGVESQKQSPYIKKSSFMVSSIHKGRSRRSGLPLPVPLPRLKVNPHTNVFQIQNFVNPEYVIDISKGLDFPMHQFMPHQKLELQSCELSLALQDQVEKLKIEKIYLPVYYQLDDRLIPVGLLKVNGKKPLEFLIYMANFIEFNPIFHLMREKKTSDRIALNNAFDSIINQYLLKTPAVYDIYIIEILMIRGFPANIKPRHQELLRRNQQIQKLQSKEKAISQQRFMVNAKNHQKYSSTCCPVYSNFYHKWSSSQKAVVPEDKFSKDMRDTIERMLELKMIITPYIDDDIYLETCELKSMTLEIDSYNIKTGGENEPLGNPYRKRKRIEAINANAEVEPVINFEEEEKKQYSKQEGKEIEMKEMIVEESNEDIKKIEEKELLEFYHTHQQSKNEFQQIQKLEEEIKSTDMFVNPQLSPQYQVTEPFFASQDNPSKPFTLSDPKQEPEQSEQAASQLLVRELMGTLGKNEKGVQLRFNSQHIAVESYLRNKGILNQNNIN